MASQNREKSEVSKNLNFGRAFRNIFVYLLLSVMIATEAEMMSAKLLPEERDFCAHKLLEYKGCRADVWPFVYKCTPEKHEYLNCQYEE